MSHDDGTPDYAVKLYDGEPGTHSRPLTIGAAYRKGDTIRIKLRRGVSLSTEGVSVILAPWNEFPRR